MMQFNFNADQIVGVLQTNQGQRYESLYISTGQQVPLQGQIHIDNNNQMYLLAQASNGAKGFMYPSKTQLHILTALAGDKPLPGQWVEVSIVVKVPDQNLTEQDAQRIISTYNRTAAEGTAMLEKWKRAHTSMMQNGDPSTYIQIRPGGVHAKLLANNPFAQQQQVQQQAPQVPQQPAPQAPQQPVGQQVGVPNFGMPQ